MRRTTLICVGVLVLPFLAIATGGCSKSATPTASETSAATSRSSSAADADAKAQDSPDPKITAALAKLSAEDRALAVKQKLCPVSGEPLGSMGAPVKVDVKGNAVFICCDGCREQLLAKPDEFLAKINK
jgi:Cu(I)/Ag(I) efflux system membrane fusion protein